MDHSQLIEPVVGEWYRSHGQLFEVVALDETERVIEIQHADGDLEEIEFDDWSTRCRAGSLDAADAPEDLRMSADTDPEDLNGLMPSTFDELRGMRADALGDLDLFD